MIARKRCRIVDGLTQSLQAPHGDVTERCEARTAQMRCQALLSQPLNQTQLLDTAQTALCRTFWYFCRVSLYRLLSSCLSLMLA